MSNFKKYRKIIFGSWMVNVVRLYSIDKKRSVVDTAIAPADIRTVGGVDDMAKM